MRLNSRVTLIALAAMAAAGFGAMACSESNEPTTKATGTGGSTASGQGGSTSTATGEGGVTATGEGGATASGSGGTTATAEGGSTATGAAGAAAGSGGASTTTPGECAYPTEKAPLPSGAAECLNGEAKSAACTAAVPEGAACYKTCGPTNSGWKKLACTGGTYTETSSCEWTRSDYSLWKVPAAMDASCPAKPQAGTACTTGCQVCGNAYLDTGGADKAGFCVCVPSSTGPKWSCGSVTTSTIAWPCPTAGAEKGC